jgi:exonuclease III
MASESVLVWNVCGLNAQLHKDAVRELVAAEKPSIVCLEETKIHVILVFDLMQIVGAGFDYFFLPVVQTRGGILVAWKSDI